MKEVIEPKKPVELMAMNKAIIHWENIISGEDSLESGELACSLCDVFREVFDDYEPNLNLCWRCPLDIAGHGCTQDVSAWKDYRDILREVRRERDLSSFTLLDISDEQRKLIIKAANKMRDTLVEVRKDLR